jgi:hypothetical protein
MAMWLSSDGGLWSEAASKRASVLSLYTPPLLPAGNNPASTNQRTRPQDGNSLGSRTSRGRGCHPPGTFTWTTKVSEPLHFGLYFFFWHFSLPCE